MTPVNVLLDRWQFGVRIAYHSLFVPLTIGLAFLVAIMQLDAAAAAGRRPPGVASRPGGR